MSEIRRPIVDDTFASTIVITAVDGNVLRVAPHPTGSLAVGIFFVRVLTPVARPNEEPDRQN